MYFLLQAFAAKFNKFSPAFKKLSLAVSLFHAAINERTEYTHCGWNQEYNFGETDYELCIRCANPLRPMCPFNDYYLLFFSVDLSCPFLKKEKISSEKYCLKDVTDV